MDGIDITDWNKLGSAIRAARLNAGLTQQELAERSGTARSWIARMEAGHRKAELEQLLRLLDALNLRIRLHPTVEDRATAAGEALGHASGSEAALAEFSSGNASVAAAWHKHAQRVLDQDLTRRSWAHSAGASKRLEALGGEPEGDAPGGVA